MRVKIRRVIDLDAEINISKLSPLEKIIVPILKSLKDSKFYRRQIEAKMEKEQKERIAKEERLKESILSRAYGELTENKWMDLNQPGLVCKEVGLTVNRAYESVLHEVIKHQDFSSYHIHIWECNKDLLMAYPKLKIVISVSRKVLGRETNDKSKSLDLTIN
jgi:hypothetical protein